MDSVPPSETSERPLSFLAAAGWTLLFALLFLLSLQISEAARPGALSDVVTQTACGVLAYSMVVFFILRVHEPESSIRHILALRPPSIVALLLAVVVGVCLAVPASWLESLLELRYPLSEKEAEVVARLYAAPTPAKKAFLIVAVVVVGPVFDELFFRGALFTPLAKDRRAGLVVLATAAYETLVYLDPRKMLTFFVAVVAFGWIRALTGSVVPSIAARMAFYGVGVVPILLGRDLPRVSNAVLGASLAVAALGIGAIAALSRRDHRALPAQLEDGD